jgi:hypothetical protein
MSDYVYSKVWSAEAGTQLLVPAGENPKMFALDYPPAGLITKVIVKQVGGLGTLVPFTVNLYDAQVGGINSEGNSESLDPSSLDKDLAKIIPTQTQSTGGSAMELFNPDGYSYRNKAAGLAKPERKIYIEIDPQTPLVDSQWEVALSSKHPQPG